MIYYSICTKCKKQFEYSSSVENRFATPVCCGQPTKGIDKPKNETK